MRKVVVGIMNGDGLIVISVMLLIVFLMLVNVVTSQLIIRRQQKTIDGLNDRLMARSYGEYKSLDGIKEEDASPAREEEPKSWHDH